MTLPADPVDLIELVCEGHVLVCCHVWIGTSVSDVVILSCWRRDGMVLCRSEWGIHTSDLESIVEVSGLIRQ